MRHFRLGFLILLLSYVGSALGQTAAPTPTPLPSPPFNQCPPVGLDTGCAILLVIDNAGSLRVVTDPSQGPYDGIEDTLIGVQNNSQDTVLSIPLKGSIPMFAFDGDGPCGIDPNTGQPFQPAPAGCPFGPTTYEGPGISFSNISPDFTSGTVNFAGGLAPGASAFFGLEEQIQTVCAPINGVPLLRQFSPPWATDTYDHRYISRSFPSETKSAVSPTGNLELAVFGIGQAQPSDPNATLSQIALSATTNNLDGLRDAINALNAGVTARVSSRKTKAGTVFLLSLTPDNAVNSIELRQTPGDATSNILTTIRNKG